MPVNYKQVQYLQKYKPSNLNAIGILIEFIDKVLDP